MIRSHADPPPTGSTPRDVVESSRPPARAPAVEPGDARPVSATTRARLRAVATALAPAVMAAGLLYHPRIGTPSDPDFLARLAAAVAADPGRWAVAHLTVGVGSGLLILAFLAVRGHLREAGEERWSPLALPFVVMGSVLFALLPGMEFAPLAAAEAGADIQAAQAALMPRFRPVVLAAAIVFAPGALGFAAGIARGGVLNSALTWLVVGALIVMAAARFVPLAAAQLYVGPAAGIVALWPLAYAMWRRAEARSAPER